MTTTTTDNGLILDCPAPWSTAPSHGARLTLTVADTSTPGALIGVEVVERLDAQDDDDLAFVASADLTAAQAAELATWLYSALTRAMTPR